MNARDVRKIANCALYVGVLLILFVFFLLNYAAFVAFWGRW